MNRDGIHTVYFASNIKQTKKENSYTYTYNFRLCTLFTLLQGEKNQKSFLNIFPIQNVK